MQATIQSMSRGMGGELFLTLSLAPMHLEELRKLQGEQLEVRIDKHRKRRSKDANALCWAICHEIGTSIRPPIPKEEVYRKAIRDVGAFTIVPIKSNELQAFTEIWARNGTGWFVEVEGDSKLEGFKRVFIYYGSSTYDSRQMSVLLDYLVDEAQQMGITLRASKREIEEAKRRWGDG